MAYFLYSFGVSSSEVAIHCEFGLSKTCYHGKEIGSSSRHRTNNNDWTNGVRKRVMKTLLMLKRKTRNNLILLKVCIYVAIWQMYATSILSFVSVPQECKWTENTEVNKLIILEKELFEEETRCSACYLPTHIHTKTCLLTQAFCLTHTQTITHTHAHTPLARTHPHLSSQSGEYKY